MKIRAWNANLWTIRHSCEFLPTIYFDILLQNATRIIIFSSCEIIYWYLYASHTMKYWGWILINNARICYTYTQFPKNFLKFVKSYRFSTHQRKSIVYCLRECVKMTAGIPSELLNCLEFLNFVQFYSKEKIHGQPIEDGSFLKKNCAPKRNLNAFVIVQIILKYCPSVPTKL